MKTVLIVDDEEPIRDLLAIMLIEAGYRVLRAADGGEALVLATSERPDLILSDVMMPVLSGVELSRRLRLNPELRDIPIILMSAGGARVIDVDHIAAFVNKPFDLDAIESLVKRCAPL